MDLFTAKKLTALRKYYSLSQEALAEKAGVSRQAVSKWERCEASPDTDNMLILSKIYSVSLDDLLGDKTAEILIAEIEEKKAQECKAEKEAEISETVDIQGAATDSCEEKTSVATEKNDKIIIPCDTSEGISEGKEKEESDGGNLPAAIEAEGEKELAAGKDNSPAKRKKGLRRLSKKKEKLPPVYPGLAKHLLRFPYIIVAALVFVALGFYGKIWHPGWLVFLSVPAYYFTAFAFFAPTKKKILKRIPVYYFAAALYLTLGILGNFWAQAWFIFLLIPLYYWAVSLIKEKKK